MVGRLLFLWGSTIFRGELLVLGSLLSRKRSHIPPNEKKKLSSSKVPAGMGYVTSQEGRTYQIHCDLFGVKLVSCDLYHVIGFKGDLRPPNFARHPPCISSLKRELSHEDEVTFSKPHRIHGD